MTDHHRPAAALTALSVVVLSYGLMQTMLVPTIGALQHDLHTGPAAASWAVLSAMLLASAVLTPVVGRLADRYGRRRALLWSLVVYLAGTLGAIVAPTIGALIACRAVQGVSLTLLPLSFALTRDALPARRVPFGLALLSGLVTGTAGVGLLLGGLLVDLATWRALFVVGAVIVLAALLLVARYVPDGPGAPAGRLDAAGAALLSAGLVSLLLGITQGPTWGWTSAPVTALVAAAAALLTLFVVVQRRVTDPLVDIHLLTRRPLAVAHLGALALGVNQFILYVLLPRLAELPTGLPPGAARLLHYGFGTTVTGAALMLLPGTLLTLPASWLTGPLERRLGPRAPLAAGLALAAAGALVLAVAHRTFAQVLLFYLISSAGYGFAMAALPRLVNHACPPHHAASANGANTVARTIGGAVGSQIAAAALAGVTIPGTALPADGGFTLALTVAAVVATLGVPVALLARDRRVTAAPAHQPDRPTGRRRAGTR